MGRSHWPPSLLNRLWVRGIETDPFCKESWSSSSSLMCHTLKSRVSFLSFSGRRAELAIEDWLQHYLFLATAKFSRTDSLLLEWYSFNIQSGSRLIITSRFEYSISIKNMFFLFWCTICSAFPTSEFMCSVCPP